MTQHQNVTDRITAFNTGRDPERLAIKYRKMKADALGFFRGTCHLFAEDWPVTSRLNETPAVWVCGDLHIENFGAYRGDNRLLYFDITDFDESVLAPCAWDLTRLAASALIAAKVHGMKRKEGALLCREFLKAYTSALHEGKARWIERSTAKGLIGSLLHRVGGQTRAAFLAKRIERGSAGRRLVIDHKRTLPTKNKDRRGVKRILREFAKHEPYPRFYKVLDVARRIAGTGSLGLQRYTILVEGRGGRAGEVLLDLKVAAPSALAPYVTEKQPKWPSQAERVVFAERSMQATSVAFLRAVSIDGASYVLRELLPTEDKLDLKKWRGAPDGFPALAHDLGNILAWDALRSGGRRGSATIDELIAFADEQKWQRWVIDYAEHYRDIAWKDWKNFREAYRQGAVQSQ